VRQEVLVPELFVRVGVRQHLHVGELFVEEEVDRLLVLLDQFLEVVENLLLVRGLELVADDPMMSTRARRRP